MRLPPGALSLPPCVSPLLSLCLSLSVCLSFSLCVSPSSSPSRSLSCSPEPPPCRGPVEASLPESPQLRCRPRGNGLGEPQPPPGGNPWLTTAHPRAVRVGTIKWWGQEPSLGRCHPARAQGSLESPPHSHHAQDSVFRERPGREAWRKPSSSPLCPRVVSSGRGSAALWHTARGCGWQAACRRH